MFEIFIGAAIGSVIGSFLGVYIGVKQYLKELKKLSEEMIDKIQITDLYVF